MITKIHSHTFHLIAAQCDAQQQLPIGRLVQYLIECATEHADMLGCGFKNLQAGGMLWVLSRLAFEMKRYPKALEDFTINTWIENFNRHFSQRNFEIVSTASGEVIGYARTIWVAIDSQTRRPAIIDSSSDLAQAATEKECPIEPPRKLRPLSDPTGTRSYTFRVSDIDFNRHVNSVRYVELMLNSLTLADYDTATLTRMDIDYKLESHYGDEATVKWHTDPQGVTDHCIEVDERAVCMARMVMTPNN